VVCCCAVETLALVLATKKHKKLKKQQNLFFELFVLLCGITIRGGTSMKGIFVALAFIYAALAVSISAQTVAFTNVSVVPMDR
jgi:cyanate permease